MTELPRGWAPAQLSDLGASGEQTVLTGPFGSNLGKEDFATQGVPVFTIGCLGADGINRSKLLHVSPSKAEALAVYKLRAGDFLFSRMASVGRAGFVPAELEGALFNYHLMRLRLNDRAILPRFFYYFVRGAETVRRYLEEVSRGATRDGINTRLLLQMPVEVPPLVEQRRIVEKIDSVSSRSKRARGQLDHVPRLVEKYKQTILSVAFRGELTREWRKGKALAVSGDEVEAARRAAWNNARSTEQVNGSYKPGLAGAWYPDIDLPIGWTWASLDQIAFLVQYGTSAKTNDDSNGVAVLRMGNIQEGKLALSSLKFLPKEHRELPGLLLRKGDVIFNRTNSAELVGKSAVYRGLPDGASFASYLIRVRCSGLLPELLSSYINSSIGRKWVASVVNQQVGQANVNGTKLRELGVPVMPMAEQREIARRIDRAFTWIDLLAAEAGRARKLVDRLDEAILAKAFRGELVPQDTNDEPANVLLERIMMKQGTAPSKINRTSRKSST